MKEIKTKAKKNIAKHLEIPGNMQKTAIDCKKEWKIWGNL